MTNPTIAEIAARLSERDNAVRACPVRSGSPHLRDRVCPKCKATDREPCGIQPIEDYRFVEAVRTYLQEQER